MTTTRQPKWDELIPLPSIFDPNVRTVFLKSLLIEGNPNYQNPRQHSNIKAAISMYESGKLNGNNKVLIAGGKVVNNEEALEGGLPVWSEVSTTLSLNLKRVSMVQGGSFHQFTQKASYPVHPQRGGHVVRSKFSSRLFALLIFLLLDHNPVSPTNSLRRSRLNHECACVV